MGVTVARKTLSSGQTLIVVAPRNYNYIESSDNEVLTEEYLIIPAIAFVTIIVLAVIYYLNRKRRVN